MRYIILVVIGSLLFSSCTSDEVAAQANEKNYDLKTYLHGLDSLGVDIEDDTLLFEIGYQNIYYGQNERGNALIQYAFSKMDSISAEDYRHWSVQNTKNGNYAKAIELLEIAMKLDPEDTSYYYGWVLLYYYRDYEKALKILNQFDAYTPNFSDTPMGEDIHYLKGLCHMQMGDYQKALEEFNKNIYNVETADGEDWVDVYAFVEKGRCLTELGQFTEAIETFEKAIRLHENCTEAHYFLGLTHLKADDNENACISFNNSLDLVQKRYRSTDAYVEYFHEIYPQQIEKSINENCLK